MPQAHQHGPVVSSRRLYLTKENTVVDENDPDAVTLLATAGSPIPFERAKELGLIGEDNKLRPDLFGFSQLPAPVEVTAEAKGGEENDFGKSPASTPDKPANKSSKEQ